MRKSLDMLLFSVCLLVGFTATAFAAGTASPDDGSLLDLARPVFDAVMHGQWWLGASLAVVLLCAAARKYLPDNYGGKFIRGDVGGVLLAFMMSFGGAVATALTAGAAMSGLVALTALKIALAAAGGYTVIHKLASAFVASVWFQSHAPGWLKLGLGYLLALVGSNAIEKAEAAGKQAVETNPAKGSGQYTDVA